MSPSVFNHVLIIVLFFHWTFSLDWTCAYESTSLQSCFDYCSCFLIEKSTQTISDVPENENSPSVVAGDCRCRSGPELPFQDRSVRLRPGLHFVRHLPRPTRLFQPDHFRTQQLHRRSELGRNSPVSTALSGGRLWDPVDEGPRHQSGVRPIVESLRHDAQGESP